MPQLAPFGAWAEQLIAESTGKQGTGIVPVDGEPLGAPEVYGDDRVFVRVARPGTTDWHATTDAALDALAAAGHPVIEISLEDGEWLGGEFFRRLRSFRREGHQATACGHTDEAV